MSIFTEGLCYSCGTAVLAYDKKALDVINRALMGETIEIVSDRVFFSPNAVRMEEIGLEARYLEDPVEDGVLVNKFERERIYDTEGFEVHIRTTNHFSIDPKFLKSRADFERVELCLSKRSRPFSLSYSEDEFPKCPVCGGILARSYKNDFYTSEKEACRKKAEQYVSDTKQNCIVPKHRVEKSAVEIQRYLDTLIGIEAEIYYFTNRLESLFRTQKKTGRNAFRERCSASLRVKESIEGELEKAKIKKAELKKKYRLLPLTISPDEFGLDEPVSPVLKKAGLFNRKRIDEENRQVTEQYDRALSAFRSKWEQIEREEIARRTAENETIKENRSKAENDLNALIDSLTQKAATITPDLTGSGIQEADRFCLAEIEDVKEKIRSLCDVRAQLISLDVIYPKYLDIIALTTIAEYFETGRCSSLEGPDGAYNLYESEIRANRIIAQLDQVIASLETIKQTQYKAYSVLSQISYDTTSISNKMSSAVKSLNNISQKTAAIKETNEQIAYNTAKTAYYSKVNAELTDALGYMMAFK